MWRVNKQKCKPVCDGNLSYNYIFVHVPAKQKTSSKTEDEMLMLIFNFPAMLCKASKLHLTYII